MTPSRPSKLLRSIFTNNQRAPPFVLSQYHISEPDSIESKILLGFTKRSTALQFELHAKKEKNAGSEKQVLT
jgi:hypothetical protein